jgi:hypothetical protein
MKKTEGRKSRETVPLSYPYFPPLIYLVSFSGSRDVCLSQEESYY